MADMLGWKAKLGIDTANPVTTAIEFTSENLKVNQKLENVGGTRGTLEEWDHNTVETERFTDGPIEFNPTPAALDIVLPLITGDTLEDDTTAMLPTFPIPDFYVTVDRHTKVFTYDHLKVGKMTVSAAVAGPMKMVLDLLGFDETTANAGTFPAITPAEQRPYIMSDAVATVGGTEYPFKNFSLVLDNMLEREHYNSVLPTRINQTGRTVTWNLELPAGDAIALNGASAASPVAVQVTFTNGTKSIKFRSEKVRAPKDTPVIGSTKGAVMLRWVGTARITAAEPDILKITHDVT